MARVSGSRARSVGRLGKTGVGVHDKPFNNVASTKTGRPRATNASRSSSTEPTCVGTWMGIQGKAMSGAMAVASDLICPKPPPPSPLPHPPHPLPPLIATTVVITRCFLLALSAACSDQATALLSDDIRATCAADGATVDTVT